MLRLTIGLIFYLLVIVKNSTAFFYDEDSLIRKDENNVKMIEKVLTNRSEVLDRNKIIENLCMVINNISEDELKNFKNLVFLPIYEVEAYAKETFDFLRVILILTFSKDNKTITKEEIKKSIKKFNEFTNELKEVENAYKHEIHKMNKFAEVKQINCEFIKIKNEEFDTYHCDYFIIVLKQFTEIMNIQDFEVSTYEKIKKILCELFKEKNSKEQIFLQKKHLDIAKKLEDFGLEVNKTMINENHNVKFPETKIIYEVRCKKNEFYKKFYIYKIMTEKNHYEDFNCLILNVIGKIDVDYKEKLKIYHFLLRLKIFCSLSYKTKVGNNEANLSLTRKLTKVMKIKFKPSNNEIEEKQFIDGKSLSDYDQNIIENIEKLLFISLVKYLLFSSLLSYVKITQEELNKLMKILFVTSSLETSNNLCNSTKTFCLKSLFKDIKISLKIKKCKNIVFLLKLNKMYNIENIYSIKNFKFYIEEIQKMIVKHKESIEKQTKKIETTIKTNNMSFGKSIKFKTPPLCLYSLFLKNDEILNELFEKKEYHLYFTKDIIFEKIQVIIQDIMKCNKDSEFKDSSETIETEDIEKINLVKQFNEGMPEQVINVKNKNESIYKAGATVFRYEMDNNCQNKETRFDKRKFKDQNGRRVDETCNLINKVGNSKEFNDTDSKRKEEIIEKGSQIAIKAYTNRQLMPPEVSGKQKNVREICGQEKKHELKSKSPVVSGKQKKVREICGEKSNHESKSKSKSSVVSGKQKKVREICDEELKNELKLKSSVVSGKQKKVREICDEELKNELKLKLSVVSGKQKKVREICGEESNHEFKSKSPIVSGKQKKENKETKNKNKNYVKRR